jgi:hypothetical protein
MGWDYPFWLGSQCVSFIFFLHGLDGPELSPDWGGILVLLDDSTWAGRAQWIIYAFLYVVCFCDL